MRRFFALIVGAGLALGLSAELHADSDLSAASKSAEVIALVSARISGDADPALRGQMQQAIRAGLESAGLRFMGTSQLRKALGGTDLLDCTSETCLQQISDRVGATRFLRAHVDASGASYSVSLELLDIDGKTTHKLQRSCAVCTIVELNDFIGTMASDLLTAKPSSASPVLLVSQPAGAALEVDGVVAGIAPYSAELAPGPHTIVATAKGYAPVERTIEVTASTEALRFEIVLVALDSGTAVNPRPMQRLKWYTGAGAALALLTGGVLLSLDGNTTSCAGANSECKERYSTTTAGALTLVVGVALGGTSTWMFLRERDDARRTHEPTRGAGVSLIRGGALATFTTRF